MIYFSGVVLAFFLCFMLLSKKQRSGADRILAAWLFIMGVHQFAYYNFSLGHLINNPSILVLGFALPLFHGPMLYLYTRHQTAPVSYSWKEGLHVLPILANWILFLPFHFLPYFEKVALIQNSGQGFETEMMIHRFGIYLSGIIYVLLSLRALLRYRKRMVNEFSNIEKINFNWLLYLILWIMLIWALVMIIQHDEIIFIAVTFFVIWIGYFGLRQVQVFHPAHASASPLREATTSTVAPLETIAPANPEIGSSKYQRSSLNDTDVDQIYDRLKLLLYEKKPYTNPDLTLNDLAGMLAIHPNHLSQVINSKEHKNFYDLINERRIEEFKQLAANDTQQRYTLLALAFDCGFNSKASFNRNFKKYTGMTPSEYINTFSENKQSFRSE